MLFALIDRRRMTAAIIFLLCFFVTAGTGGTAQAAETEVYFKYGDFTWKEFDGTNRLLRESGALMGPGFSYFRETPDHLTVNPKAELFVGDVDYDGQVQSGEAAKTTVTYVGVTLQGDLGRRFGESAYVEPFLGIGYRFWLRQIQDGRTASGQTAVGYTERWTSIYARLGLRGGVSISESAQVFAEAGVKLPYYNQNSVALSGGNSQSDFSLRPGLQSSFFAELGVKMRRLKGSLFYDGMRFSRSNPILMDTADGVFVITQPQSTSDTFGLMLGVTF
jgi:hypothetical protein